MNINQLKRKLRELKKIEVNIRCNSSPTTKTLVWNKYFSTKDEYDNNVKYNLNTLKAIDHNSRKEVFEEYFYEVYFQKLKEDGITYINIYDPNLLCIIGLSPTANIDDIKKRFKELAKKYHPDLGGDNSKMIELLDIYNTLLKNK